MISKGTDGRAIPLVEKIRAEKNQKLIKLLNLKENEKWDQLRKETFDYTYTFHFVYKNVCIVISYPGVTAGRTRRVMSRLCAGRYAPAGEDIQNGYLLCFSGEARPQCWIRD